MNRFGQSSLPTSAMSAERQPGSTLTREEILKPREVLDLVAQYYPTNRIAVKTQYLVEGLFEEGKI